MRTVFDFIRKEWLLVVSCMGFAATSLFIGHLPDYSAKELQVLFILFALFVTVTGLQKSGILLKFARRIEKGDFIPVKLVVTTYFLSMLVTNDIALIVMVPLTLLLDINRKDILVILEALAANAGSALTPLGNPQNLFIYWFYEIHPVAFIETMAPFSIVFLVVLLIFTFPIKTKNGLHKPERLQLNKKSAYIYGLFLIIILMAVLHVLPVLAVSFGLVFVLIFDRKVLRIDYALLISFFFFFGLAENTKQLLAFEISHSGHIFLLSALTSQILSNVPTSVLFARFTAHWEALLWGVNAGGFGSLFGSLANLIAYKIYVTHESSNKKAAFTIKFLLLGYAAFMLSIGLYYFLY